MNTQVSDRDIDNRINRVGKYAPEPLPMDMRVEQLERRVWGLITFNVVLVSLALPVLFAIALN